MPLQKLQFRPGVNRESTTLANEGGWFESDKVRFRSGFPEKIGGWVRDTGTYFPTVPTTTLASGGTSTAAVPPSGAFWGVVKSMWNWLNLVGYNLLAAGTNLKYYIQNSSGGAFNDITPIRLTTAAGVATFTATAGSSTLTVTSAGHGAQVGDFVCFSSAAGLGGNITATVLNKEYQIKTVTSNNSFTITATANAGAFVSGVTYTILTVGTTNFTLIGASANTVGTVFTATGAGTGNGTAAPNANATDASGSPGGGASTVADYQLTTGNTTFTLGTGWGVGGWGGYTPGTGTTTLNGSINSSVTSIVLTSAVGFSAAGVVLIDSEQISYTGISTNTLTGCTRGANGSTAASHTSGVTVQLVTGWGSPAPAGLAIAVQLRLWSEANFGQDLIINPRGGAMYYWQNNTNPNIYDRAQVMKAGNYIPGSGSVTYDSTTPSVANFVLVSDASRFVFSFGCNDPTNTYATTAQDPLQVRWSDQGLYNVWTPSITNQAGGIKLSRGSTIISALQTRQEVLVWTDAALYSFQYLGPPYVWGSQILADNISIISPNATAVANNVAFWMGADKFYMYTGRVETLPCSLRQYIYDNINLTEAFQIHCGTNEGYNEIWWFYPSITGTNTDGSNGTGTASSPNALIDRYVIYNHLERTWYYGTMDGSIVRPRTAWLDSPLRAEPTAAIGYNSGGTYTNGAVVYHETGIDNNETGTPVAIDSYVQSSDFDIGEGHNYGFVWRVVPDVTFDGSTGAAPSLNFTIKPRQNPGSKYGDADNPTVTSVNNYQTSPYYNVQQFTQIVYVRARGRQMAFRVECNNLGTQWQLGTPRIDARPDGRR